MRTLSMFGGAALDYAWVSFRVRVARARSGELQRGASAVEWVVISMIVVGLCVGIGVAISLAVHTKTTSISGCINGASSTNTTDGC